MPKNNNDLINGMEASAEKKKILKGFFKLFPNLQDCPDEVYQLALLLIDWNRAKNAEILSNLKKS